eukprot:gene5633-3816_t
MAGSTPECVAKRERVSPATSAPARRAEGNTRYAAGRAGPLLALIHSAVVGHLPPDRPPAADPVAPLRVPRAAPHLSRKERNRIAHSETGNGTAMKPKQCREEIERSLIMDGVSPSQSRSLYDALKSRAGGEEVQRIARIPLQARVRAVIRACRSNKIDVSTIARIPDPSPGGKGSQSGKGKGKGRHAGGRPAGKGAKGSQPHRTAAAAAAADATATTTPNPLQLRADDWSVPVRDVADLRRDTGENGGGVARASQATATEAAATLEGCTGAIALVTRQPVTGPDGGKLPCDSRRVLFVGAAGAVMLPSFVTQLGDTPVQMKIEAAATADARPPATTDAMLLQFYEAKMTKEARMKEADIGADGKRRWAVIAKVKPGQKDLLMSHSGTGGVDIRPADMDINRHDYAVVPVPRDTPDPVTAAKRYTKCTHGVIYTVRGPYYRCRTADQDALRAEVMGRDQAARLSCPTYTIDNAPPDLPLEGVLAQLDAWVGGFNGHTVLEAVRERPSFIRSTQANRWIVRSDKPPIQSLPAVVGDYCLLVQREQPTTPRVTDARARPALGAWAAGSPFAPRPPRTATPPPGAGVAPAAHGPDEPLYGGLPVALLSIEQCRAALKVKEPGSAASDEVIDDVGTLRTRLASIVRQEKEKDAMEQDRLAAEEQQAQHQRRQQEEAAAQARAAEREVLAREQAAALALRNAERDRAHQQTAAPAPPADDRLTAADVDARISAAVERVTVSLEQRIADAIAAALPATLAKMTGQLQPPAPAAAPPPTPAPAPAAAAAAAVPHDLMQFMMEMRQHAQRQDARMDAFQHALTTAGVPPAQPPPPPPPPQDDAADAVIGNRARSPTSGLASGLERGRTRERGSPRGREADSAPPPATRTGGGDEDPMGTGAAAAAAPPSAPTCTQAQLPAAMTIARVPTTHQPEPAPYAEPPRPDLFRTRCLAPAAPFRPPAGTFDDTCPLTDRPPPRPVPRAGDAATLAASPALFPPLRPPPMPPDRHHAD